MRRTTGERVFDMLNTSFMVFICVIMVFPYLNQIAISFNEGWDTGFGGITIFPRKFTLANYHAIFQNDAIMRATLITVTNVIIHTLFSLIVTVGAAYSLQKKDLPFRGGILFYLMLPMYLSAGTIPIFILFRYLRLLNNITVYYVLGLFSFYNMIVIRTYMNSLPIGLEESAKLEGANEVQILFRIILPLCMPVIATISLWLMVATWNDWTATLMYITDRKLYTLQFVVMQIIKQSDVLQQLAAEMALTGGDVHESAVTSQSVQSAAIIFSTIPIIMIYPFLQKYFVKGVTLGAIKD